MRILPDARRDCDAVANIKNALRNDAGDSHDAMTAPSASRNATKAARYHVIEVVC